MKAYHHILLRAGTAYWQADFTNLIHKESNWQPLVQGLTHQPLFHNPPRKIEVAGVEVPHNMLDSQDLVAGFLWSCPVEG